METDTDFGRKARAYMEESLLAILRKGDWVGMDWSRQVKIGLPLLEEIWRTVNMERVKRLVSEKLEQRVADHILNAMTHEVSSDVKQVLSQGRLREEVRGFIRSKIEEASFAVKQGGA